MLSRCMILSILFYTIPCFLKSMPSSAQIRWSNTNNLQITAFVFMPLPAASSCAAQNFTECCIDGPCISADETCYCDRACYRNRDCCVDIIEINCFPPGKKLKLLYKDVSHLFMHGSQLPNVNQRYITNTVTN